MGASHSDLMVGVRAWGYGIYFKVLQVKSMGCKGLRITMTLLVPSNCGNSKPGNSPIVINK